MENCLKLQNCIIKLGMKSTSYLVIWCLPLLRYCYQNCNKQDRFEPGTSKPNDPLIFIDSIKSCTTVLKTNLSRISTSPDEAFLTNRNIYCGNKATIKPTSVVWIEIKLYSYNFFLLFNLNCLVVSYTKNWVIML